MIQAFKSMLIILLLTRPLAYAGECLPAVESKSILSAQEILNALSPRSLSVWMLSNATIERKIISDSQGVAQPGSYAIAKMVINRNLEELKGTFGSLLQGHFPGNPVVPGVIQAKMMAQVATFVLNLAKSEVGGKVKPVRILELGGFRFNEPLYPGAHINIRVELLRSEESNMVFKGTIEQDISLESKMEKVATGEFTVSLERSDPGFKSINLVDSLILGTERPLLTRDQVREFLPHRDPLLLIDTVLSYPQKEKLVKGDRIVAELTTTQDMLVMDKSDFHQGVVPADIQVEIMAQASAFVLYNQFQNIRNSGQDPQVKVLLTGIKSAQFFESLIAGQRLIVSSEVVNSKRGMMTFDADIRLPNGRLVGQARLGAYGSVSPIPK